MITFLKHENALQTVYYALYGSTHVYSAYKAQCLFLNNSVPAQQQTINAMEAELSIMRDDYDQCFYTDGDGNSTYLEDLSDRIDNMEQELHNYKGMIQ